MVSIRKYKDEDREGIEKIIKYVVSQGDSYTYSPDTPLESVIEDWISPEKDTFVVITEEGEVVGTFYIKANQIGLGSHIANGSYMVAPDARRKGIGKLMGEFSIEEAKRQGYRAMQFNFVVKSNEKAVKLWQNLGFEIIGEIPNAFRHSQNGMTNAYIMYRKL